MKESSVFLTSSPLPFCSGCGHTLVAENTGKALNKSGFSPLDVILVTDIGCHGIIDKSFNTHTVHGLHGRSVALASGISAGLNNPEKKVIVFIGDGGVSIGMQHILDAAHNNYNMTVVVHNNMLYGMTGGQPSELTPMGFKTPTLPQGVDHPNHDICKLAVTAGANYVRRITGIGDYSEFFAEAFMHPGFSLLEVLENCPSYAQKANPGIKIKNIAAESGYEEKLFASGDRKIYKTRINTGTKSLIDESKCIAPAYSSQLEKPVRIMLSGSAGEGVQNAAEFFAKAAIKSGLHATKKGSYPVTVGVGFSSAEIIISPEEIFFSGFPVPDILIITSQDGLDYARGSLSSMKPEGRVFIDNSIIPPALWNSRSANSTGPASSSTITSHDFRGRAGRKNAALYSLAYYLNIAKFFPPEAFLETLTESRLGEKINFKGMFTF
ncbi:MAG: 2-oxoacid:acceptor oxidoreductase family protein [Bacteroidetes bacterium]|nr:2-oxoacid:acceptor oxidoreductase family protein [Bacteroidota bacterium]